MIKFLKEKKATVKMIADTPCVLTTTNGPYYA